MKAHHYLAIGTRIFAILLITFSFPQLGLILEIVINGDTKEVLQGTDASLVFLILSYILWPIAAVLLWFFWQTLAKSTVPHESNLEPAALSRGSLATLLIALLGLFFLYQSIVDGIYWIIFWNLSFDHNDMVSTRTLLAEHEAGIWATLIEFLAALVIFLKAKQIGSFFTR